MYDYAGGNLPSGGTFAVDGKPDGKETGDVVGEGEKVRVGKKALRLFLKLRNVKSEYAACVLSKKV